MDHRLLEIIACPVCNGKLYYSQDKQELICKLDSLAFPLRDGIPGLPGFRRPVDVPMTAPCGPTKRSPTPSTTG